MVLFTISFTFDTLTTINMPGLNPSQEGELHTVVVYCSADSLIDIDQFVAITTASKEDALRFLSAGTTLEVSVASSTIGVRACS
jgi:hypothetical protein